MRPRTRTSIVACLICLIASSLQAQSPIQLQTVAEATNYQATATGADVELFLKRLHKLWNGSQLESIGKTVEGRDIWALIVPPVQAGPNMVTVLLLGGIHSGECDGKEALLALARDYATDQQTDIRKNVRLIFVPNFNADGNERVGKLHRPAKTDQPLAWAFARTRKDST